MVEERTRRRLAAILAADVVGYSRLMEQDEAGTLVALKVRLKEVLEPIVARHQGRIFKVMGDGVLVEFGSAVNAVECAVKLQDGMAAANSDLPEGRHIVLRIGVNLGDVVVESGDRYGDGVNIAARLEAMADPGGVLVSGTTYDHVRNKVTGEWTAGADPGRHARSDRKHRRRGPGHPPPARARVGRCRSLSAKQVELIRLRCRGSDLPAAELELLDHLAGVLFRWSEAALRRPGVEPSQREPDVPEQRGFFRGLHLAHAR